MTDEQIIKAFEEILKNQNNKLSLIERAVCDDVLSLANRQKAEIERLEKRNTLLLKKKCKDINTARKIIKSEAIKEFVERLKSVQTQGFWEENAYVSVNDIDNLVKEMTEEEK